ncbi:MAG: hypothetical protein ACJ8AS_03300 [Hyphomicrobiales bacterium]
MSKLMMLVGVVVAAAGIVVLAFLVVSPGQMQVLGISPETSAILLVGGLGLVGIGGAIDAVEGSAQAARELRDMIARSEGVPGSAGAGLVSGTVMSAAAGNGSEPAAEAALAVSTTTIETVATPDRAKQDIFTAVDEKQGSQEAEADLAEADAEEAGDQQLYVVEEKLIRGRPARVLSDGTVEAETDEGWMRFENREHLEEYLDAMSDSPEEGRTA